MTLRGAADACYERIVSLIRFRRRAGWHHIGRDTAKDRRQVEGASRSSRRALVCSQQSTHVTHASPRHTDINRAPPQQTAPHESLLLHSTGVDPVSASGLAYRVRAGQHSG